MILRPLAAASLLLALAATTSQASTITDLGDLGGGVYTGGVNNRYLDLNNRGQAAGTVLDATKNNTRAVLFDGHGGCKDLGTLGGSNSYAYAINEKGQVAGSSDTASVAFVTHATIFSGGTATDIGGAKTDAYGLNDAGRAVGITIPNGSARAALFDGLGGSIDLGTISGGGSQAYARAINGAGQIIGQADTTGTYSHAFLSSIAAPTLTDLDQIGARGSAAYAINDAGQAAGIVFFVTPPQQRAVIFSRGVALDLGTLGGGSSNAYGINRAGVVVGWADTVSARHAFVYSGGKMTDLNDRLPPGSGWVLVTAFDINDLGQIVGLGQLNGTDRFFILNPPAPTLRLTGKKSLTTTVASVLIKGRATGSISSITYAVGKTKGIAKGTAAWKFTAKLKPGKNIISVTAVGPGGKSKPVKITVTRK